MAINLLNRELAVPKGLEIFRERGVEIVHRRFSCSLLLFVLEMGHSRVDGAASGGDTRNREHTDGGLLVLFCELDCLGGNLYCLVDVV